jgi:hypothetical protein|tara:strand:- start:2335 stop:5814 length:3480 start_codon:yes stop_codon:yes gene_type:complete
MPEFNPQQQFDNITNKYLENVAQIGEGDPEFEIRFGTRGIKSISRIDFDNVIQKLKSSGFQLLNVNAYTLKIQSEFLDKKTGQTRPSNVRVEINGIHQIQQYCESNSLENIQVDYTQKKDAVVDGQRVYAVNIDDFNLRAAYQTEKKIQSHSSFAENIVSSWSEYKKTFRYINRTSFIHPNLPIRVDMSIVKSSTMEEYEYQDKYGKKHKTWRPKPEYTIQGANVFDNMEKYEIELEVLNNKVGAGTEYSIISNTLPKALRKSIIYVLSGLQNTNYPIPYSEIRKVSDDYLKLVYGKEYHDRMRMKPKMFLGPSSSTLQMENIAPVNEDTVVPNIRNEYTVTEKADGMRKLMYINNQGKIYLIDTNMNVQYTGAMTKNIDLRQTILDGEHILHNKTGDFINLYASFDVYIINGKDVRANSFIPPPADERKDVVLAKYRLPLLINIIKNLAAVSSISDKQSPLRIENKNFKADGPNNDIFQCCNTILAEQKQGLYEYEVDGLIFTPANFGVACNKPGEAGPLNKPSWEYSFKWKPPEFNTIDFLVTTKKDVNGSEDFVGNIFQEGTNTNAYDQLSQYKTLILRVGFDEKKHGYINPCADVINDNIPNISENKTSTSKTGSCGEVINMDRTNSIYKPLPFYPTNPFDMDANICNIMLQTDESGIKRLFTEEKDVFSDGVIVEFKYDLTRETKWRWVPLRVRYDKTEEYKKGFPQYGNAYHVANNNWHSIHNPITEKMIRTGEDIPEELVDDDVYYNRVSGKSSTRGLRDFHNQYVKKLLITSVAKKGNTLIDYAVGKGGDFPKWINAKLSFVLGIDISKDNIENRVDGACARYLNYRKNYKVMPHALFVHGNSSFNIKDGEALYSEKAKQITKAVFGEGPKEKDKLGLGVYRQYGKASEGFNISSCQFAIHYFFENKKTLNNFLRNISECTKVNGYFVGDCYDGTAIFDALRGKPIGDSVSILENGKKIWQITKGYERDTFDNDETSIGYPIDVFQETINKTFREYLVNFEYLNRLLENYGFVQLTREECSEIGIPSSVGSFQQLYGLMEIEIDKFPRKKNDYGDSLNMTPKEKQISFYNNYFIYKKIRNVDTRAVYNTMTSSSKFQEQMNSLNEEDIEKNLEKEETKDNEIIKKKAPKKLKRKLKLLQVSKENDDTDEVN